MLPKEGMTDTWISWQMKLRWASGLKMLYTQIGGASSRAANS